MGQRVPLLNEHFFNDISGYLLAKDQPRPLQTCYMDIERKFGKHILLSTGQSITSQTTRTAGGKDHCHVEIEEIIVYRGDGKSQIVAEEY